MNVEREVSRQVIIVAGPTGVGKTDFALKLGSWLPAEIVNADVCQMYQPLTIGTAKPDWQKEPLPHHLFDNLAAPSDFSAAKFRAQLNELVEQVWSRGRTPIIVGGSTLYIKALFFPPQGQKKSIAQFAGVSTSIDLWSKLQQIDPVRADQIHPNDRYRLQRAIQIWQTTQQLPSLQKPQFNPLCQNSILFILNSSKAELYPRLDRRVEAMLQMGWVQEVAELGLDWQNFVRHKGVIGYDVILDYLADQISYADCVAIIQKQVRNYAKKQQTFWRSLQRELAEVNDSAVPEVVELDLTLLGDDLYLKQLIANDLKFNQTEQRESYGAY